jgi:uncharacterized protein
MAWGPPPELRSAPSRIPEWAMRRRKLLYLGAFLVSGYLAICLLAGIWVADAALHPVRRPLRPADAARVREFAGRNQAHFTAASITATDGSVLRAWTLRPSQTNGNAVILLHGLGDNRLGTLGYAELFLAHGYSILMPDARAHGVSGGSLATYGLLERTDIRQWFEWLLARQQPRCVFGFAESMGASALLQGLAVEPHFCAVAAESPFANFREMAYDRMGQPFHAGPWLGRTILRPVVATAFAYARWKYHLDLCQVSPADAVARTEVPAFLIHGTSDSNIPLRHSVLILSKNPRVVLWEVPNADHCGAMRTAPSEFERRVIEWFKQHSSSS